MVLTTISHLTFILEMQHRSSVYICLSVSVWLSFFLYFYPFLSSMSLEHRHANYEYGHYSLDKYYVNKVTHTSNWPIKISCCSRHRHHNFFTSHMMAFFSLHRCCCFPFNKTYCLSFRDKSIGLWNTCFGEYVGFKRWVGLCHEFGDSVFS